MEQLSWQRFTTASYARSERYRKWNEICNETLCRMTVDPIDRENFHSRLARVQFGPLGLARVQTSGSRTAGYGDSTGDWISTDKDCILLVLSEAGHSVFRQDRGHCWVEPGDFFFHDLNKRAAFVCDDDVEQIMIKMPYSALSSRVADPSELLGTTISGKAPNVAMAANIIRTINKTLDDAIDTDWDNAIADLALDAAALLYKPTLASTSNFTGQSSRSLRRKAKDYISRHFTDPELTVAHVADVLGVNSRQLQRTFAEVGEMPSRYILEKRLDLAARMLSNLEGKTHGSIFEIALAAGFNDPSHFGRAFSRRFDVSPRNFCGARSLHHALPPENWTIRS